MRLMLTVNGPQLTMEMEKALKTFLMNSMISKKLIFDSMKEKYMHKTQSKNKTSSFLSLVFISFPYSWPKFPLQTSHLQKHTIEKYLLDIRFEKTNPAKINPALINPLKVRYSCFEVTFYYATVSFKKYVT